MPRGVYDRSKSKRRGKETSSQAAGASPGAPPPILLAVKEPSQADLDNILHRIQAAESELEQLYRSRDLLRQILKPAPPRSETSEPLKVQSGDFKLKGRSSGGPKAGNKPAAPRDWSKMKQESNPEVPIPKDDHVVVASRLWEAQGFLTEPELLRLTGMSVPQLEAALRHPFFRVDGQGVHLTPAGNQFVA